MIFSELRGVISLGGVISFAAEVDGSEPVSVGICEHHPEHNEGCGYIEESEDRPCSHEHDENCGYIEGTEGADCLHVHDDSCYVLECDHVHTEECYADGTLPVEDVFAADACYHEHGEGCYVLACTHEHSEECGYIAAVEGMPCAHEHNEECGYAEAAEGHPCEFMCPICGVIVADWTWEDVYRILQPAWEYGIYDVDWVLDLPDPEVEAEVLQVLLPNVISAVMSNGVEMPLPISWDFENPQEYEPNQLDDGLGAVDRNLPSLERSEEGLEFVPSDEFANVDDENEPPIYETPVEETVFGTESVLTEEEANGEYLPFDEEAEEFDNAEEIEDDEVFEEIDELECDATATYKYLLYTADLPEGFTLGETARPLSVIVKTAEEEDEAEIFNDAVLFANSAVDSAYDKSMHFIVRHWHSKDDASGSSFQGDNLDNNGNRYFTVVEGYIVPPGEMLDDGTIAERYEFYLVHQDGSNKRELIRNSGYVKDSAYVDELDHETGKITLSPNELTKDDGKTLAEIFSSYSVSAGHDAVKGDDVTGTLTIEYSKYVHIVKAHAFYINNTIVLGSAEDDAVFGDSDVTDNPERDTVTVYTYSKTENGHKEGDIVKDADGKPIRLGDEAKLEALGLTIGVDVKQTRYHDTDKGLHTDKVANLNEQYYQVPDLDDSGEQKTDSEGNLLTKPDGRTFDIDLEAWHSEGYAPQIGMVIDASGSMAFASDMPKQITLTDEQISDLGINALTEDPNDNGGWDSYFLTDEQLNQVLNPRHTDNSALGVSGYSYFVHTSSGDYTPLGYWEGVPTPVARLSFNKGNYSGSDAKKRDWLLDSVTGEQAKKVSRVDPSGSFEFEVLEIERDENGELNWPSDSLKLSAQYGLNVGRSGAGVLLDVVPKGNFTLTFNTHIGSRPLTSLCEILYIGSLEGNANSNYLRFFRPALSDQNSLRATNPKSQSSNIIDINSVLSAGSSHSIALAFSKVDASTMHLEVYVDGDRAVDAVGTYSADVALDEFNIIFNGLQHDYSINDENSGIFIDEVTLYNEALTLGQINSLGSGDVPGRAYSGDGGILGSVNYSSSDASGNPALHHTSAGWYFVTFAGNFEKHYQLIGTGKRLIGLNGTQSTGFNVKDITGRYSYTNNKTDTPVKFYVDADGNLCCFYSSNSNINTYSSYVYELSDDKYVRTETLQRALGVFVTDLGERSPASRVSAVRFSCSVNESDFDKFELLNWTEDPAVSTGMLSLERDDKTTYKYGLTGGTNVAVGLNAYSKLLKQYDNPYNADRNEVPRYLIIFTDGADDSIGKNTEPIDLAKELKKDGYIIYTVLLDGGSMDDEQYKKAHDFLIQLAGESGVNDSEDYFFSVKKARDESGDDTSNDADVLTKIFAEDILNQITDPLEDYTVKDYIDPRFDLVSRVSAEVKVLKQDGFIKDSEGNDTEEPKYKTVTELLTSTAAYSLKLKSNGRIELFFEGKDEKDGYEAWVNLVTGGCYNSVHPFKDSNGKYHELKPVQDENGKYYILLRLSDFSDDEAQTPRLYYDSGKEMYYLEWVEQDIPGSAVGAKRLAVWNARVTIRAKDDFLGGNMVLTNGNEAKMNYVYETDDKDNASSGTDHANPGEDDDYSASKGFPRVTVNVELLNMKIGETEQRVYLGEVINPTQVIRELGKTVIGDYYWFDYLTRYAYYKMGYTDQSPDKLMETMLQELADNPSGWGLDIPYYYLPNVVDKNTGEMLASPTNQPGGISHRSDMLGYLHYRWERLDPATGAVIGVGGYASGDGNSDTGPYKGKPYETLDTRRIEYRLVVSYWPFPDPDDNYWETLEKWSKDNKKGPADDDLTAIKALLDEMWKLLEGEKTNNGDLGGLSTLIQNANTLEAMGDIAGKFQEIETKLDNTGLPENFLKNGTFTALLEDVRKALYVTPTTVTIKLTGTEDRKETIDGGLKGLLKALEDAKNDKENQALRVYIEAALFELRNEIDNTISQMANYIDYLRWCYGYGEDSNGVQGWMNNDKLSERKNENADLIKDVNGNDTGKEVYGDPKAAAGASQYNKTAIGMSTIRVVRGELAFELAFSMKELSLVFESGSWKNRNNVPFYIELTREYKYPDDAKTDKAVNYENQRWSPKIPDLVIDIERNDLKKLTGELDGYMDELKTDPETGVTTLYYLEKYLKYSLYVDGETNTSEWRLMTNYRATEYPKAVYYPDSYTGNAAEHGTVIFYSDPRDFDPEFCYQQIMGDDGNPVVDEQGDPVLEKRYVNDTYARLLPIGTYTMKASTKNRTNWYMFDTKMFYASDDNYKFDSWHFTRTTNEGEPNNSVESIYFPRSGRSQTKGLGQLKAPETNRKNDEGELKNENLSVVFQLGTKKYDEGNYYSFVDEDTGRKIPQYTDDRVGMARVNASLKRYEMPATGGAGTTVFYALGAVILLVGCLWLTCLNLRSKRKI